MTAKTPTQAEDWLCPFARSFGTSIAKVTCHGPECALWRWQPLSSDILTKAVQTHRAQSGADHKTAVAYVMDNRAALGIPTGPTHGYCGAGGQP